MDVVIYTTSSNKLDFFLAIISKRRTGVKNPRPFPIFFSGKEKTIQQIFAEEIYTLSVHLSLVSKQYSSSLLNFLTKNGEKPYKETKIL